MARSNLLQSVASYAHLLGRAPKAAKASDDEKDDRKDVRKGRAEGDDDDDKKDDKKGARRAEDGDLDEPDGDDNTDREEEKKRRREEEDEQDEGRRQEDDEDKQDRRDEEDEQDKKDAEDDADPKMRAARRRERARCQAIFKSKAAGDRPDMAAHLAFETKMSRKEACRTLSAVVAGQPKSSGFAVRMAGMEQIRPGADGGQPASSKQARSAGWDRTATKLGLSKR